MQATQVQLETEMDRLLASQARVAELESEIERLRMSIPAPRNMREPPVGDLLQL